MYHRDSHTQLLLWDESSLSMCVSVCACICLSVCVPLYICACVPLFCVIFAFLFDSCVSMGRYSVCSLTLFMFLCVRVI